MQEAEFRRQEAAQRIQAEIQQQRQRMEQEQARLAQQKAIAEQELELKRQEQAIPAEIAATQFRGQKMYEDILGKLVSQGVPEEEAQKKALMKAGPFLFARNQGGFVDLMNAIKQRPEAKIVELSGQKFAQAPTGTLTRIPLSPEEVGAQFGITRQESPSGRAYDVAVTGTGSRQYFPLNAASEAEANRLVAPALAENRKLIAIERQNQKGSKPGKRAYDDAQAIIDRLQEENKGLEKRYRDLMNPKQKTEVGETVTTKEQYDALSSGAVYTGKDGRKYRKP
jgi:hypothetical protein